MTANSTSTNTTNTPYLISINLLYPAILGTILYNLVVSVYQSFASVTDTFKVILSANFLFSLLLITIYIIDYIYVNKDHIKSNYNWLTMAIDSFFIILIAYGQLQLSLENIGEINISAFILVMFINRLMGLLSEVVYSIKLKQKTDELNLFCLLTLSYSSFCVLVSICSFFESYYTILIALLLDICVTLYARSRHKMQ